MSSLEDILVVLFTFLPSQIVDYLVGGDIQVLLEIKSLIVASSNLVRESVWELLVLRGPQPKSGL